MRLVTTLVGDRRAVGVMRGDTIIDTGFVDMLDLIDAGRQGLDACLAAIERGPILGHTRLSAPLTRPGKILCTGVNYLSHLDENPGAVLPKRPFFFSKLPTAIVGPGDPIVMPYPECHLDYEVELAVVIGRRVRRVVRGAGTQAVFGYTILNDVSARDLQFATDGQLTLGKGLDSFCPMGPWLVTADEIPDPCNLAIRTEVNGEERQSSSTSAWLFDIDALLEAVSEHVTLEPGDVVSTGTPGGVGVFRVPPVFLQPGDVIRLEVEHLGALTNPVVAGWSQDAAIAGAS